MYGAPTKSAFDLGYCFFHNLKPSASSVSRFDASPRFTPGAYLFRLKEMKTPSPRFSTTGTHRTSSASAARFTPMASSPKQSALNFWQGVLGMPFIFELPNLGKPDENHLYFDPGDGRLLTVFTNESREDAKRKAPRETGCAEHLAFNVSRATFALAPDG